MKGVILAGGNGTRLRPITNVTNKHLLPVYDKPMIYYPLNFLAGLGIKDLILISGREFAGDFANLLGDGSELGVDITYKVQEKPMGIAHAAGIAEKFAGGDSIITILGDNLFYVGKGEKEAIRKLVREFDAHPDGAYVFLKEVADPERFGVAVFGNDGSIVGFEEKPKVPKSNYALTGLYMYDNTLFEKVRKLKPSWRGELELTDVNNAYVAEKKLKHYILKGDWTDAGTFDTLVKANVIAKEISDKEQK